MDDIAEVRRRLPISTGRVLVEDAAILLILITAGATCQMLQAAASDWCLYQSESHTSLVV